MLSCGEHKIGFITPGPGNYDNFAIYPSVISRRCLVATGILMFTFILPYSDNMSKTFDMMPHYATLGLSILALSCKS